MSFYTRDISVRMQLQYSTITEQRKQHHIKKPLNVYIYASLFTITVARKHNNSIEKNRTT